MSTDLLKKYLTEDGSSRILICDLQKSWQEGLSHQKYPPIINRLLGELCAASTLLSSTIKFDGSLVLQLQGDGPIALIVVECTNALEIRATVQLRENMVCPENGNIQTLLNTQGKGRFMVILDPKDKSEGRQPYQGIVALEGNTVAEVLSQYMKTSEQLDTTLWLSADDQRCAGLLLQRLPDHGGDASTKEIHEETWNRCQILANTVTMPELQSLDSDSLIHRLFWEESLQVFESQSISWHCPCNRNKVADMLKMLGAEEIADILSESDAVNVLCQFCGKPYRFDSVDCAALFIDKEPISGTDTKH